MKYIFLSLLFCSCYFPSFGQLEIKENLDSGFGKNDVIKLKFTVFNRGNEDAEFSWALDYLPEQPTDWIVTSVKDQVICYSEGYHSALCENEFTNFIAAGDSVEYYQIQIWVLESFDEACITFRLLDACIQNASDTLATVNFKFDSEYTSSTEDINKTNAIPFPNPLTNTLSLKGDDRVAEIRIFDVHGREIKQLMHRPGWRHDVPELAEGIYLLQLIDMGGRYLQTIRIIKQ